MAITSVVDMKPGDLYTTSGFDVWFVESFCEQPTVTLRRIGSDERTCGAVGCLNLQPFVRLRPEQPVEPQR